MMSASLQSSDRGFTLVCAAVTPFHDNGDLDVEHLVQLFERLRAAGVRNVFAAGTTGEFTSLSDDERMRVISAALDVFGPDGAYAHVGAATPRQAVRLTRRAAALGVRRFAAITPYFVTAGPESVYRYYEAVAAEVGDGELFAYVFRDRATTDVTPATLARIAAIPGVRGAKLSGLSNAAVADYVAAAPPGFTFFSGNDRGVLGLPGIGAHGLVSGVSSVFPELFVRATAAIAGGESPADLQESIETAVDAVGAGDIGLLKAGLARRGLPVGPLRVSLEPADADAIARLDAALLELAPSVEATQR